MLKAASHGISWSVALVEKTGGKRDFHAAATPADAGRGSTHD